MGYTAPTTEPASLRAGDTWRWVRGDLSDYPAPTWTLTYYFRNAASNFDVVATADGAAFAVSVAPATTAGRTAGAYDWTAFVADGTDRHQVGAGRTEVLPNLAAAVPHDGRTFARRMLDAIEAALESRATADMIDLMQASGVDRSMQRDPSKLISLRAKFAADVAREDRARRGIRSNRILAVA